MEHEGETELREFHARRQLIFNICCSCCMCRCIEWWSGHSNVHMTNRVPQQQRQRFTVASLQHDCPARGATPLVVDHGGFAILLGSADTSYRRNFDAVSLIKSSFKRTSCPTFRLGPSQTVWKVKWTVLLTRRRPSREQRLSDEAMDMHLFQHLFCDLRPRSMHRPHGPAKPALECLPIPPNAPISPPAPKSTEFSQHGFLGSARSGSRRRGRDDDWP